MGWEDLFSDGADLVDEWYDIGASGVDPAEWVADTALSGTGGAPSWWDTVLSGVDKATTPGGLSAISGLTGLATNYLGGTASQEAARKALSSLQAAYAKAGDASTSQFQTALELGRPYRELGAGLMPTYTMFASGASPGRKTLADLAGGGLYEWKKKQTLDAIDKAMAARGRFDSGANIRARTDAVEALSGAEASDRFNRTLALENMDYGRLSDAMNLGAGFSNQGAGLAVSTGNTLANIYGTGGQAAAAQQNNVGNASKSMYSGINNAVQGGLNTFSNLQMLNKLGGF